MHALERQYALVERAQSESRAIFDASSEAFLFISASGQVNALNRLFREFFAMSADGVIGTPFAELQPRWEALLDNATSFHADLAQDDTNQERCYATTVTQKEPKYRELAVSSTPVPSSTNVNLGRLYILRDITREREVERLKAEFDAMVSHGLRSPLTSIKGYTELLVQQEETGPLTDLQREFLEIVLSNTRRLMALVNDLLDMSRLEAQTMVIRPVPLDLHSLIHEVTRDMRPQIEERHQQLSLRLASPPLIVLADEILRGANPDQSPDICRESYAVGRKHRLANAVWRAPWFVSPAPAAGTFLPKTWRPLLIPSFRHQPFPRQPQWEACWGHLLSVPWWNCTVVSYR